jgi:hypothetical protein
MRHQGGLSLNDCGRWEFNNIELTSGSRVEICIDGVWLVGVIESSNGKYYWFSIRDSIPVILRAGIQARINCGYGQFTKLDRRRNSNVLPRVFTEPNGILASEMKKTLDVSLFDYCKEHKIALMTNQKGQTVLRGREHIIVNEFSYKNAKGGGGGKLIDFVAYHDGTDFLHAIAKIRNNPRLLLLSDVMGEQTQTYRAFYAPKPEPGISVKIIIG